MAQRTREIVDSSPGVESDLFLIHPSNLRADPKLKLNLTSRSAADEFIAKKPNATSMLTMFRGGTEKPSIDPSPDVIHLHWWYDVDIEWLRSQHPATKFVFSLHDDRTFTGGCHSAGACSKHLTGCKGCPIVRPVFQPLIERNFETMREKLSKLSNVKFLAPSENMKQVASESGIDTIAPIEVVPNPVSDAFWKISHNLTRKMKESRRGEIKLGFIAQNLRDPNKNVWRAIDLVAKLRERGIRVSLELVGYGKVASNSKFVLNHGPLRVDQLAWRAAHWDALISCSNSENAPLAIVEMALLGVPTLTHSSPSTDEVMRNTSQKPLISDWKQVLNGYGLENLIAFLHDEAKVSGERVALAAGKNFGSEEIRKRLLEVYELGTDD